MVNYGNTEVGVVQVFGGDRFIEMRKRKRKERKTDRDQRKRGKRREKRGGILHCLKFQENVTSSSLPSHFRFFLHLSFHVSAHPLGRIRVVILFQTH